MLRLPNLDDRMYDQMVEEARKQIPSLYPVWTDENAHDPGITMLELFTWLIEMQQFYLNRVTEKNELKFLKLLGIKPKTAGIASVEAQFEGVTALTKLPRGTKLAAGGLVFETAEPITLVPGIPDKIIVRTESAAFDYSASNASRHVAFPAFGAAPEAGNRLYLGFALPLPEQRALTMSLQLFDRYPIVPVPDPMRERVPSARLEWQAYAGQAADGTPDWQPLTIIRDETSHLSQSGKLLFKLEQPMRPRLIQPATDRERYWISCVVVEPGFELPPRLEHVALNAVTAFQYDTDSLSEQFDGDALRREPLELSHYLAYFGDVKVQVRSDRLEAWEEWSEAARLDQAGPGDRVYTVQRDSETKLTRLTFGDGKHGALLPTGKRNVRIICCAASFRGKREIGMSSGLPNQAYELPRQSVVAKSFMLQVGRKHGDNGEVIWHDWRRVDDFDHSTAHDRHYVLDPVQGIVRFGNNERGMAPARADFNNIVLVSLRSGGGASGNINEGLIQRFADPWPEVALVRPVNYKVATGGSSPETLEEAKLRARRELQQPSSAVTADDVERIVRQTPGLRVARVKAIPLFHKGLRHYPQEKAPARLSVVVVPFSDSPKPLPSEGFMRTVRQHLDKHRLITTDVDILPPEYIQISVHAVIVVEPHFKDKSGTEAIMRELNRLLQPFDNGDGTSGWTFGRTVYKGDIYGVINRIPGISYIQDVWISAEGRGFRKDSDGDIQIPPYGLVYSGEHDIELISLTDL